MNWFWENLHRLLNKIYPSLPYTMKIHPIVHLWRTFPQQSKKLLLNVCMLQEKFANA